MKPTPWLPAARGRADARMRIFCFPYSGGSAALFRGWPEALPADVETCAVEPPGRGTRRGEAPFHEVRALAEAAAAALASWLDRPFALFGHSVGALVAFEVARRLRREGLPSPHALLLAGHRPPTAPYTGVYAARLTRDELMERVARLGGTPAEVLAEPELLWSHERALRADFSLSQAYVPAAEPPLDAALHAFAGADDPVAPPALMQGWRAETRGAFTLRRMPGGHFFIHGPALPRFLRHHLRPAAELTPGVC